MNSPILWFTPQMAAAAGAGAVRSFLGVSHKVQRPKHWSHLLLPSQTGSCFASQAAGSQVKQQRLEAAPTWNDRATGETLGLLCHSDSPEYIHTYIWCNF